ncbi:Protein C33C12.9 [Aphelenchoides avenae]|nr:Protein C33C12.9 [Aphelenchus avenae]
MNKIPRSEQSNASTGPQECVADRMDFVQSDLLKPLENRLRGQIDVIVFNPPYVCTEQPAQQTSELYYAGGPQGRSEVERLLDVIPEMLSNNGVFYVVALRQNNIPEMLRMFEPRLQGSVVIERRCGIEHLFVLKYIKA